MSQQQSQAEQDKINKYLRNNPIGQIHAERLLKKLHKNMCQFFHPYKQYFNEYPVNYLIPPRPTYIQKQKYQQKIQLSYGKQMQYYRGSTKHHIDEQLMKKALNQDMLDRGFVENCKNISFMYGDTFIYATGNQINSIKTNINQNITHNGIIDKQPIHIQFDQKILELMKIGKQKNAIVRCTYWIYIIDLQKNIKIVSQRFNQQITAIQYYQNGEIVLVATYDYKQCRLYKWEIDRNIISLINTNLSLWPVHSIIHLNKREFIIGFSNKIMIFDIVSRTWQSIRRVSQIGNDRYCAIISVKDQKNQIVLSRSQFINVFDLRKYQQNLLNIRHFCEQAPPSCLISQTCIDPIIIAYSPVIMGSSLLININSACYEQIQAKKIIYQKMSQTPILLYDSGKYYNGLHPRSVTTVVKNDILTLFHLDSSDGIAIQNLKIQKISNLTNVTFLKSQNYVQYPVDPCMKWVEDKILSAYLKKQVQSDNDQSQDQDQQSSEEQKIVQNRIFRKYNNYCSLDLFRNRLKQISNQKQQENNEQHAETYPSTFNHISQQYQSQQNDWTEVINYTNRQGDSAYKINQKLLKYIENDWKI